MSMYYGFMAFKQFTRKDVFTRDSSPKISIRKQHIGFNGALVKQADLQKYSKVKVFIDEDNFKIGFKFHNDSDPNSLAIFSDNPSDNTKATSAIQLIKRYGFIKKISEFTESLDKQFEVSRDIQDKNLWVIQLCPAFEHTASSESELKDLRGIYQYMRSGGEVVYIGKGNILSRLNSSERSQWDFDVIEYSMLNQPLEQSRWESFWLNKYVEKNGRLPFYNKIKGSNKNG